MPKKGIVNVRMVITEEKILSNIEKVERLVNPKSKKQIVELDDNSYFKDLVESIKTYLAEYPKKKNFPTSVYDASYRLIEYATEQFELGTKETEDLIKQREYNIKSSKILKQTIEMVKAGDPAWKNSALVVGQRITQIEAKNLSKLATIQDKKSDEYKKALKTLEAKVSNLESNLHIEIDLERLEDRLKALSYIAIEISDPLKTIPIPADSTIGAEDEKASKKEKNVKVANITKEEPKEIKPQPNVVKSSSVEKVDATIATPENVNVNKVSMSFNTEPVNKNLDQVEIPEQKPVNQMQREVQQVRTNAVSTRPIATAQVTPQAIKAPVATPVNNVAYSMPVAQQQRVNAQAVQPQQQRANVQKVSMQPANQNYNRMQIAKPQVNAQVAQQAQYNRQAMANQVQPQYNYQNQYMMNQQNAQAQQPSKDAYDAFYQETTKQVKPSLWERFKNSKFVKAIKYVFKIRLVLQLPEGEAGSEDQE